MLPLLNEAFHLLHRYAKSKETSGQDRRRLQAGLTDRHGQLAFDIEVFNRLVTELSKSKGNLPKSTFEQKLILVSVYASKISTEFDALVRDIDAMVPQEGLGSRAKPPLGS